MAKRKKKIATRRAERLTAYFVVAISLLLSGILLFAIISMRKENKELALNEAQLESNVTEESLREEELQQEKEGGMTEKRIVEIAKEKFGLLFKDEIIFVPKK